ncbi:hypothetical protein, partial, partial [Parasitella parasitica]
SLSKPSKIPTSQSFSRFLTSQHLDILCLQETHAKSELIQQRLDMQLKTHQSIWTSHCGIVSLNPQVNIESLYVSIDDRVILCRVSQPNNTFPSFTIMNIYAPATHAQRYAFYANLLQTSYFQTMLSNMTTDTPLPSLHLDIILGDFNYDFKHFPSHLITDFSAPALEFLSSSYTNILSPVPLLDDDEPFQMPQTDPHPTPLNRSQWIWHALLLHHFKECSHQLQADPSIPTFRRESTFSTIDYIFASQELFSFATQTEIQFISGAWTDHALLRFKLRFTSDTH